MTTETVGQHIAAEKGGPNPPRYFSYMVDFPWDDYFVSTLVSLASKAVRSPHMSSFVSSQNACTSGTCDSLTLTLGGKIPCTSPISRPPFI